MNGYFNINKPAGMSSAAVVAVMRRLTGEKRVGHAGTLDPEAAGVLPIMTGKATRLFDYLTDKEKEYRAVVAFGTATDTQDATGAVTETGTDYPSLERIRREAAGLTGEIRQKPSMYSAIKVQGQPLYARARRGETVDVPERTVQIGRIEVIRPMPDHGAEIHVWCGKGTYIRTLCDELGRRCGCPAHMRSLVRTRSGMFTLEEALSLDEARELAAAGMLAGRLIPPDAPLVHLPAVRFGTDSRKMIVAGAALPVRRAVGEIPPDGVPVRAYLEDAFWGIMQRNGDRLTWRAQIAPEEKAEPEREEPTVCG